MSSRWYILKQQTKSAFSLQNVQPFCKNCYSQTTNSKKPKVKEKKSSQLIKPTGKNHTQKVNNFFNDNPHLKSVKDDIPSKYFDLKRKTPPENYYLIDEHVAKTVVAHVLPALKLNGDQLICETNAGLGLITAELLKNGVPLVRMYESCPEFKEYLKKKFEDYQGRVELFTKDIFLLSRYEYIDKQDNGERVRRLLQGVPRRNWTDDPVMTIIGPMANQRFLRFLLKSLVLQSYTMSLGRFQLFAFMKPGDYLVSTAGPHLKNLHTYQRISVLFNLFFEFELLEKFPREVFLPWQSSGQQKLASKMRYPMGFESDLRYFVKIGLKKDLPVSLDNVLPLYVFVNQFYRYGNQKIIPILEKWVPGVGLDLIYPKLDHVDYFKDLNSFTKFGELTPPQILAVFQEMITHPEYTREQFITILESDLIKTETIETAMDEHLEKNITSIIDV